LSKPQSLAAITPEHMATVTTAEPTIAGKASPPLTNALIVFLAFCCGAVVANIYYAQPIVAWIAPDIGLAGNHASLVVSLTQFGYALGLLFLVPLADLLENRRLVVVFTFVVAACLAAAGFATGPSVFLVAALLIGCFSVSVQIMVPLAAHMAPEQSRGRVVGNIMGGLVLGILLSRPVSSTLAHFVGWRGVFYAASALMAVIALVMVRVLPKRQPAHSASYLQLMHSVFALIPRFRVLRQRSMYHGLLFISFSLFWTIAPIELVRQYGFTAGGVALFALLGAAGALAAPLAGRLADAGHGEAATRVALVMAPLGMLLSAIPGIGYVSLLIGAVVLDFAVQMNMVLGQRDVYALDAHSRARLNAVYMTSVFIGGALGSLVASPLYEHFGWRPTAIAAAVVSGLAFVMFVARRKA
jgi:predicted MFS family arabinose efflux permease